MATGKTSNSKSDNSVKSLSNKLSSLSATAKTLSATAKAQGKDTSGIDKEIRKSDSMVRQTKAEGSKKYAGSTFDTEFQANEKVINSMSLKPQPTVTLPTMATTPISDFATNNAGLTGGVSEISYDGTNLIPTPVKDEYAGIGKAYQDYFSNMNTAQEEMETGADIRKKLEKETGIKRLRQEEADYASQINTITAKRDAAVLSLEGQGRGQTEGFIGGEQARINREAAIKALPIQAQLAAAQNKVQLAQEHINTWGSILTQDAQNKYNFKKEMFASYRDFLTDVEKMRLSKLEKENDRKYQEKQDNIKYLQGLTQDAIANGNYSAISVLGTINPDSKTFASDVQSIAKNLVTPKVVLDPVLSISDAEKLGVPYGTTQSQASKLGIVPGQSFVSENIQNSLNSADPVTTKATITSLLGSGKIQAGTKGRIAPALAVLNSVDELANMNLEGEFTGIGIAGRAKEWIKGIFNVKSPEATTNQQNIDAINLKVQQWASGASLTEQQTKQVNKLTPTNGDSDRQVRTKLNGLYNFMLNQTESELLTEGINVQFPTVNLFEIYDLYKDASPEQKKIIDETYFNKR